MINLTFHNGTRAYMLGVPKETNLVELLNETIHIHHGASIKTIEVPELEGEVLGLFTPPSELSMEVKEEEVFPATFTRKQSFISYLMSEIKKSGEDFEKYVLIQINK